MSSFGIGCFGFEMADPTRPFTLAQWSNAVTAALLAMPNVADVEIILDELMTPLHKEVPGAEPPPDHAPPAYEEFVPTPADGIVEFTIHVPSRLHPDLLDGQTLPCERFLVRTHFEWSGPCTFVTCLEGEGAADGSLAVMMLWRYFKRELSKHTDAVRFSFLGPSPYHARFQVVIDSLRTQVGWERVGVEGYEDIRFDVPESACEGGIEVATEVVQLRLAPEAALYYAIIRDLDHLAGYSRFLDDSAKELVATHQRPGLRGHYGRLFRSGRQARALGLQAMEYELRRREAVTEQRETTANRYLRTSATGALRTEVENELARLEVASFDNALEVVRFLEGSRTKEMEIAVVATSTLLGGLAGAAAALLAR